MGILDKFLEPTVLVAVTSVLSVFISNLFKNRFSREANHFKRLEQMIDRQTERVEALEESIYDLEKINKTLNREIDSSDEYITILRSHIIAQLPPPPPERPL